LAKKATVAYKGGSFFLYDTRSEGALVHEKIPKKSAVFYFQNWFIFIVKSGVFQI